MQNHLAVLAFTLASTPVFAGYEQLVSRSKPAVVLIEVSTDEGDSSGTGFFASSDGYIVTNQHVVSDVHRASDITITGSDGTDYKVQGLAYSSKGDDIAILKVDGTNLPYLRIDPNDDLAEGQTILTIGNPKHFTGTVSAGLISAIRKDYGVVQISAPISLGSSGSPVLDEQGMVVAVVVGLNQSGQNINFAIPADKIRLAISSLPVKNALSRAERPPRPALQNQADAELALNASYQALRNTFDPDSQELLRQEELAWLKKRDRFKNDPNTFFQITLDRLRLLRDSLIMNQ